ncbi:hypothetical protein ACPWT1_18595 [Ramlibacter sp. MMS24-I3-19]|uniref:hypothetical protein n=1 Tax=Ramlibacter sp. MMS24-I3-19 TaxID=3416606 RepID=UPI003CFC2776
MHTALCAFDDHAAAERARDRLLQAGFDRSDVHLQHRGTQGTYDPDGETRSDMLRHRGGVEHEVALSPDVVERVTHFFGHLFGRDNPHRGMWDDHVHGGRTVVVVDTRDEVEAERARAVLAEMQGSDVTRVHRPEQQPLRDIVAGSPVSGAAPLSTEPMARPGAGLAADATSRVQSVETGLPRRDTEWTDRRVTSTPAERAVASGEQRPLDLGRTDQDTDKVGLRYADKDDAEKPAVSRDGLGRTRDGE